MPFQGPKFLRKHIRSVREMNEDSNNIKRTSLIKQVGMLKYRMKLILVR